MKLIRFIEASTGKYVCATQHEDGSLQIHTYMHRELHPNNIPETLDIDAAQYLKENQ